MPAANDYSIVSMIDVKSALDIKETNDEQERLLSILIPGVTQQFETFLNRPVVARVYTSEPYDGDGTDTIFIPAPLITVTTLINDGTTIASTDYWFYRKTGKIQLKYTVFENEPQCVVITHRSGWEPNDVPHSIRVAALMAVKDSWHKIKDDRLGLAAVTQGDQTFSYTQGLPVEVTDLIAPYRIHGWGC